MPTPSDLERFDQIRQRCQRLREALRRVIVGQEAIVEPLLLAVLAGGHVLVIGVPGLAKTLLVRTLARALDLSFKRIQFTPDLMPSDILGTELIQEDPQSGERRLRFVPGPVFAQLLLADEINRTPPKTQAALLEAMAEHQVTVAGRTLPLAAPFLVVATQNPIEQEGTYPLPEAQLDRFMFSLGMDYPEREEEVRIVAETPRRQQEAVERVFTAEELLDCTRLIGQMPVGEHLVRYAVDLARASRPQDPSAIEAVRRHVTWGAGPRAAQALVLGARTLAAMEGLPTPAMEHVRRVAPHVLRHRLVLSYGAVGQGVTPDGLIDELLRAVTAPREVR